MLQIITEKFYKPGERYETLHRAVFYTNYKTFMRSARIETPVGVLLPTTGIDGLAAFTCEILEKIEKHPDGDQPGVMISTGGASLLNDFAAVVAFALNVTCTPDPDLTRRLLATERPSLGAQTVPSQLIRRTFDREIISKEEDALLLTQFIAGLVGLERRRFEAAMKSIRQYITGLHRIADNISLSYTQLVMSIESLAQEFDGHIGEWPDYDHKKRERIDEALEGATEEIGRKVRDAVLENEHIAVARRFRDFSLSHISPSFFREEAALVSGPISSSDLPVALQHAYAFRSRYVHSLKEIPKQLAMGHMHEMVEEDGRSALSVAGLARLARHIVMQFVIRGPILEKEEFNYQRSLPNIVTLPLSPEYWIANTGGFTSEQGPRRLSAFIGQITSAVLLRTPNAKLTDIRAVLALIESMLPGLQSAEQRLPLLTLYFLFHQYAGPDFSREQWPAIFEAYKSDFEAPTIESFVAHILSGNKLEWSLQQLELLNSQYFKGRHRAKVTKIGRLLEAAFTLCIAEMQRDEGDELRARELVALAVDRHPGHIGLRSFESALGVGPLPEIRWETILLPPPTVEEGP